MYPAINIGLQLHEALYELRCAVFGSNKQWGRVPARA
jgi:hypothetical protein